MGGNVRSGVDACRDGANDLIQAVEWMHDLRKEADVKPMSQELTSTRYDALIQLVNTAARCDE